MSTTETMTKQQRCPSKISAKKKLKGVKKKIKKGYKKQLMTNTGNYLKKEKKIKTDKKMIPKNF